MSNTGSKSLGRFIGFSYSTAYVILTFTSLIVLASHHCLGVSLSWRLIVLAEHLLHEYEVSDLN